MDLGQSLKADLANRYLLEDEIDTGGVATVYRARDLTHDFAVAIKVLKPDLAEALGAGRFLGEIRALDVSHLSRSGVLTSSTTYSSLGRPGFAVPS